MTKAYPPSEALHGLITFLSLGRFIIWRGPYGQMTDNKKSPATSRNEEADNILDLVGEVL